MEERIYLLIAKSLNREASPAEQQELEEWLQEDEGNKAAFRDMEALWHEADTLLELPAFDTAAAWDKVSVATEEAIETIPAGKRMPFRKWISISAAAAAIAAIIIIYSLYPKTELLTVTASEQTLTLELPDHSKVRLQAGSTLTYPKRFADNRRDVSIQGEAFFDVSHNPDQPFVIDAGTVDVQVLGTSFYVTTVGDFATVAVTSGKVSMADKKQHKIVLTPGHKGIYDKSTLSSVTDTNAVYYRDGILNLTGLSLTEALKVIEQVKNIRIVAAPGLDATRMAQQINISFQQQTKEQILEELCLITNTRWKKDGEQYLIYNR